MLGKSVLALKMGKFCQIITELWPLIYLQNYVLLKWMDFDKIVCFGKH